MKRLINTLLFAFSIFLIYSCTKECTNPPVPEVKKNIEGLWIGTYSSDQLPNDPNRYYSFIIKPNGKLLLEVEPLENQTFYAKGTWTLDSTTLKCVIHYQNTPQGVPLEQVTTAKVDFKLGKITEGVWVNNGFPGGTGKFSMNKIE